METARLVIDWTQMPTYNTVMSIAVGAGLISLVTLLRNIYLKKEINFEAWSLSFLVPGLVLTTTGLHMTLTWPFAKYFPFDNIIFGETSLAFGILLLVASFYLWKRGSNIIGANDPAKHIGTIVGPLSTFIGGMGLALFAIACAGVSFKLFAAPPEEPITGVFAEYPWIEAIGMSGLLALVGVGAVLTPFAVKNFSCENSLTKIQKAIFLSWLLSGYSFLLFGALNFYTHIGLIVNTMPK